MHVEGPSNSECWKIWHGSVLFLATDKDSQKTVQRISGEWWASSDPKYKFHFFSFKWTVMKTYKLCLGIQNVIPRHIARSSGQHFMILYGHVRMEGNVWVGLQLEHSHYLNHRTFTPRSLDSIWIHFWPPRFSPGSPHPGSMGPPLRPPFLSPETLFTALGGFFPPAFFLPCPAPRPPEQTTWAARIDETPGSTRPEIPDPGVPTGSTRPKTRDPRSTRSETPDDVFCIPGWSFCRV
jgi:hypothetical protein